MPRPSSRSGAGRIDKPVLTLYGRLYCHLCEDMLAALQALRDEYLFDIEVLDIDMSDELRERYGSLIPVLALDTEEICHFFFDAAKVREVLSRFR